MREKNSKYETCSNCNEPVLTHRICKCGYYKGKKVSNGWSIR